MRGVREHARFEDLLSCQEAGCIDQPPFDLIRIAPIFVEAQFEDVFALAAHGRPCADLSPVAGEQGDGGEEPRGIDIVKRVVGMQAFFPGGPVFSSAEVVGRKRRRDEFEHRERDAPGVHLLEKLADRLLKTLPAAKYHLHKTFNNPKNMPKMFTYLGD